MTEHYESRWRYNRMLEERARRVAIFFAIMAVSVIVAIGSLYNHVVALSIFGGLALLLAAFLKPELTLIVVTVFAPLLAITVKVGSIIPGTGITPLNAMMILLVVGTWLHRWSPTRPAAEATEIDKPLLLLIAWSGLSIITASLFFRFDPTGIGEWLQFAAGYMTYWVVRRRWHSRRLAVVAVLVVLGMLTYQAAVVLKTYVTLKPTAFSWDLKWQMTGLFVGGNSNDTGAYLSCYALVALGLFMLLRKSLWRWPSLVVFGLASAAAFATYSRAAMLALLAGGICMALYKKRGLLIPLIAVIAILPSVLPGSIAERFGNTGDASAENRKDLWKRAAGVTIRNPLTGVGWRAYSKTQENQGYKLRDPHNMYLLVSAEQGIPGLVFFLGALIGAGKVITRILSRKNHPFVDGLALGMFGALICFAVNNLFGSRMIYFYVMQHFWLLLGLLVVLANPPPQDGIELEVEEEPEPVAAKQPSPWRYRSYV